MNKSFIQPPALICGFQDKLYPYAPVASSFRAAGTFN